jgi:putative ABC transport system permease protein
MSRRESGMFWSYVKTVFRNLSGSKVYFFINIAGLAIGFTVFSLIMSFVLNELNYDTFNKKADRIYRVVEIQKPSGTKAQQVAITMPALGPALKGAFPEISNVARFTPWSTVLCHYGEKRFYEDGLSFADSSIFDIFTFHFIEGDPSTALDGPYDIVIDESTAHKYFGDSDPMWKTLTIEAGLDQNSFLVTGVIKDFPGNSHLQFNMIASLNALERRFDYFNGWTNNDVVSYVLLRKGYSPEGVDMQLPRLLKANLPENVRSGLEMYLQPLRSIHLHSNAILFQVNYDKGDINYVTLFILIAFVVIVLACINFINLTTARSAIRTREVGIRKLLGSYHSHLVYQFIGESVVLSLIGMLLSLPVVEAVLPTFNSMMGGSIIIPYNNQLSFMIMLVLIAGIVGFIAGVYPAFYLSSFQPVELLRGRYSSSKRGIMLRKTLIILQFSIAITLVTATGIAISQMEYIDSKPLGFDQRDLMYIPLRDDQSRSKIQLLSERLLDDRRILSVSAGELTGSGATQGLVSIIGTHGKPHIMVRNSYVDYDYIKTMGMTLAQGRDFMKEFPSDSACVIINETMARTAGWRNPIGEHIQLGNGAVFSVAGVVKDFNYFSLRNKVDPLVMWLDPGECQYLLLRIAPLGIGSTVNTVKNVWDSVLPAHPFEYGFLANYLEKQYGNEEQNEHLLVLFSLVAIVIACLGLFGLTLHTTEQRIKEIGVRKVLGASVADIVITLSKESIKLVFISAIVAWPTAYYFMSRWLQNFAYRINLSVWIFVLSGLIVFFIAILTLSFQAIKAGISNPVDALRYE